MIGFAGYKAIIKKRFQTKVCIVKKA
jgi:hypothetical protein